jgi:raffinose/stachyose/melibiose transport system permease protein
MKNRKTLFSTLFLAPAFLVYSLFIIFAVVLTIYYSLGEWDGIGVLKFNNFLNYIEMFKSKDYLIVFKNTFIVVLLTALFQVPMGILFAWMVFVIPKGYKFFRSSFFLPVVISNSAVAIMFMTLLNDSIGPVNFILRALGLDVLARNWLSDPATALYAVAVPQLWHYIGLPFVLFLAGFLSLPQSIIESARIDGAKNSVIFRKIAMPMISNITKISVVICVTGTLKAFESAWIMTTGGPGLASAYLSILMYRSVFRESDFGFGSAIAVSILLYSLLLSWLIQKAFKSKDSYLEEVRM